MKKAAMLFPGQASQFVGMGKDYYDRFQVARRLYKEANARLGFDIAELSFSGDIEELTKTKNAQPAILLHSIVVLSLLAEAGVEADVVAGHSLGEFSALVAAGCLKAMDALLLVRRRGELMYEAGERMPGTMAAIIGLEEDLVEECIREASSEGVIVIANYNSPNQVAVSGEVPAVEAAVRLAKEKGARRAMKLNVSGAFHSPLMKATATELMRYMDRFEFRPLQAVWISNVTGKSVSKVEVVKDLLFRQLFSPVRWVDCAQSLCSLSPKTVYEVGPGNVLAGLMKRIDDGVEVISLSSVEALEGNLRA